jgi:hypothetical protein
VIILGDSRQPLANVGFYQAAAGVLAVLLITGVVAELRGTRDRPESPSDSKRRDRAFLAFLALWGVVLVGELATFTVLLRDQASGLFQATVGLSLIVGLIGIPGLAIYDVIGHLPLDSGARRRAMRAATVGALVAVALVAALVVESQLTGKPAVGSPTRPERTAGQIEQGNIVRASLTGAPGGSYKDPLVAPAGSVVAVGMRLSNGGPDEIRAVRVKAQIPPISGDALAVTVQAVSSEANPSPIADTAGLDVAARSAVCLRYVPGSAIERTLTGAVLRSLPDGITDGGVTAGPLGVPLEDTRTIVFKLRLEPVPLAQTGSSC